MQVLIVDDNILDRKFLKYILERRLQIFPSTAKDGYDALKKIKSNSFDLVVTDIVMPKMEGIELINNIKTLVPQTKIIAVSGNNPYYLYIVKKMGIEAVFTKPINIDRFIELINHISQKKANKIVF